MPLQIGMRLCSALWQRLARGSQLEFDMASVTIGQVEKYFGRTHIIKGVSIDIADGEFCVLVGPSGCGKSTLLRMIAGLEEISAGDIHIGAQRVKIGRAHV